MQSPKTIIIALILSVSVALVLQYRGDGPAGPPLSGDANETPAGPSGEPAKGAPPPPDTPPGSARRTPPDDAPAAGGEAEVAAVAPAPAAASAPSCQGTPMTRPWLDDDDNPPPARTADREVPEPVPMTPEDRALLQRLGVDLEHEGLTDRSAEYVEWFPGREEAMLGADGMPLPEAGARGGMEGRDD